MTEMNNPNGKKEELSGIEKFQKQLEFIMRASFPFIWIRSYEEERTLKIIHQVILSLEGKSDLLYKWDNTGKIQQYIEDVDEKGGVYPIKQEADPIKLFPAFVGKGFPEKAVLAVMDFQFVINQHVAVPGPQIIRSMKSSAPFLKKDGKMVIFVAPRFFLPEEIEKDVTVIDFPLPDRKEMKKILDFTVDSSKKAKVSEPVPEEMKDRMVDASLGLTSQEGEDAFSLAVIKNSKLNDDDSVKTVLDQKVQILKKEGIIEYVPINITMKDVGGYSLAKEWLTQRKMAFSQEALEFGLLPPKGLLLVGISGCGKSLMAKAAASIWGVGLYRWDMGKTFSKFQGETESNVRKVIKTIEIVAPCVLWIDEIEKGSAGIGSSGNLDSGTTARMGSSYLTWMQEKTAPVFVVATANNVMNLPPEMLRKGRFDEIFFVDLPNEDERFEIFKIHLAKVRARSFVKYKDVISFSDAEVTEMVSASMGYTGAEIEQSVLQSMYVCYGDEKRKMKVSDLVTALTSSPPLSKTMEEDINFLRKWGEERCKSASGKFIPPKNVDSKEGGFVKRKLRV